MTGPEVARVAALGIGGFQLVANAAMLIRGPAWCVATVAGVYYVAVGLATFMLGLRRHAGLLVFVLLGVALLVPLWAVRGSYLE